jgi:hypothetical protein
VIRDAVQRLPKVLLSVMVTLDDLVRRRNFYTWLYKLSKIFQLLPKFRKQGYTRSPFPDRSVFDE